MHAHAYWSLWFGGGLVAFFLLFLGIFAIRSAVAGMPVTEDVRRRANNRLLGVFLMEFWYWMIRPVERTLIRFRISANTLSALSFVLSALAGAAFVVGWFGLGGWLILFGATFDIFDGRVARALGTAGPAGAFIDSTLDRYGELAALFGLCIYYRNDPWLYLVLGSLAGSAMVSYTRARGEGLGVVYAEGLMQRGERAVFLGLACAFSPFGAALFERGAARPTYYFAVGMLGLIAVLANVSALQRMVYIARKLREKSAQEPTPPAASPDQR